jgi:hypothetical protein
MYTKTAIRSNCKRVANAPTEVVTSRLFFDEKQALIRLAAQRNSSVCALIARIVREHRDYEPMMREYRAAVAAAQAGRRT